MPEEFSRTTKRKQVTLPNGGKVDVPVITAISFIDASGRYQEIDFTIENSADALRTVHVDNVKSSVDPGGPTLAVERIDRWKVLDAFERHQETEMEMDNVTGGDSTPPHFSTHSTTHVVRYVNDADTNVWIKSELIDEFSVIDPYDRHQETIYALSNPETEQEAQADPADPDISDSLNGVDPPWRVDPFQNIIDWGDNTPQVTGDDRVRISFTIETFPDFIVGTTGSPPNVNYYVYQCTPHIRGLRQDATPSTSPHLVHWSGIDASNWTSGLQLGNPDLNSPDIAQASTATWSASAAGYTVTMGTITFGTGDTFIGGSANYSGVRATWDALDPYYRFMSFIPESLVVDDVNDHTGHLFIMTLVEDVTA